MLLHVLGHIEADDRLLRAEHRLGKSACKFRLADARRSEEEEGADRTARILNPRTGTPHRLGDRAHRLILTDDTTADVLFESEQTVRFLRRNALYGNSRPLRYNIRNIVLRDDNLRALISAVTRRVELGTQFLLAVTQPRRRLIVLTADRCILLLYNLGNFCTQTRDLVGVADILHAHTRCCLIHQVDCLVRQTAIRDVALREAHRRANGGILNARTVELLVFTAQPAKNLLCILLARLFHHDGLEAAREGAVLGEVLLVLAECRRADDLHLPACKGGFQNVRGIE